MIIERPDGTKGTIVVKQSKDSPAPLVEQTRELRLQAVSFQQRRQQGWHDRQAARTSQESDEREETSRTRKRREKRQQQRKDAAELKVLRAAEQATAEAAQRKFWESDDADDLTEGMLRQALGQISQLSSECTNQDPSRTSVGRNAVLSRQGEPSPVKVLAGSVGSTMNDEELGKVIVDALVGYPTEQLGSRFSRLASDLASSPAIDAEPPVQTKTASAAATDAEMSESGWPQSDGGTREAGQDA